MPRFGVLRLAVFPLVVIVACAGDSTASCAERDATCFTSDFYAWYARPVDSGGAGIDMMTALRKRPGVFAPTLLSALAADTAAQAVAHDLVGIDADPFVASQDPCPRYRVGRADSSAGHVRVPVFAVCGQPSDSVPILHADVIRNEKGFQFANFIYDSTSDLLSELAKLRAERGDYEIARGACPFECCRYGEWVVKTRTKLWREPGEWSDSIGVVGPNEPVKADSGQVWLHPTGLAIVTNRSLRFDSPFKPPVRIGDTLYLLDYHGEGYQSVRWRDSVFSMEEQWDSTGAAGARLVRQPVSSWWVHVTAGARRGWILMTRAVEVTGADACGG